MNWPTLKLVRDSQLLSTATARLLAAAPKREERKRSVYVLKIGERYKIGLSVNPTHRVKGMQLPSAPDWMRSYEVPHAAELEKLLHKRFHDKREYFEWFLLHNDDLAQIERIVEEWRLGGAFLR